jgi:hypothetical protein
MCRLYFVLCKRYGPRYGNARLTISAWLWKRELEGKGYFFRGVVDDYFLCFRDQEDHCLKQYLRETANTGD